MIPLIQDTRSSEIQTDRKKGSCQGWVEGGIGIYCLMDIEFHFANVKSSGDGWW